MKEFVIDLFCGAGGTSTGVHLANDNTTVVACVNHDKNAIESHKRNHPKAKHFVEDIRDPKVVESLGGLVGNLRSIHPECIITIWASLECTNFSKAKGGLPREADSRTLAEHLFMYVESLNPDFLMIENVVEFMAWGPLDENGRPVSMRQGSDYMKWVNKMQDVGGFDFDFKIINSADLGAYTSRTRYFAQFAKKGLPIGWPEKTHSKKPIEGGLFETLEKWKPVRDVLNFEEEGKSIFERKKPLVDNTLERIYAGLVKFVANGDESFLKKYFSGRPMGKVISTNGPAGTVTTFGTQALVKADFLQGYYGNGDTHSVDEPSPTITTKDRYGKVVAEYFIDQQYGNGIPASVDLPANTVTTSPKLALAKYEYLFNPQFKSPGSSVDKPCPTIIASQDKRPLGLITCKEGGNFVVPIYEGDTPAMIKIKKFMVAYRIVDIKMRMLMIDELLRIQGFPKDYELVGTQTEQKKFIGNSVEVTTAKKIFDAHYDAVHTKLLKLAI